MKYHSAFGVMKSADFAVFYYTMKKQHVYLQDHQGWKESALSSVLLNTFQQRETMKSGQKKQALHIAHTSILCNTQETTAVLHRKHIYVFGLYQFF
mmetsp:Transcript_32373/g.97037  ORF Transcript_32373/g.97037 Transcript_32373/m.97037 type:complete len:96 (-) Transcript_32373:1483-1770(-)